MRDEQKEEAKQIMNKYPKYAVKGIKVELDAEWKKAMVAIFAMARVNVDIVNMQLGISRQMTEAFDEALKLSKPIQLTESARKELEMTFRIKNLLLSDSDVLKPEIVKMDNLIIPNKDSIYHDLFVFYLAAKAGLLQQLIESQSVAREIDPTLTKCFMEAIQQGQNLEEIEKQTLEGMNTRQDIREIIKIIYNSVGISAESVG